MAQQMTIKRFVNARINVLGIDAYVQRLVTDADKAVQLPDTTPETLNHKQSIMAGTLAVIEELYNHADATDAHKSTLDTSKSTIKTYLLGDTASAAGRRKTRRAPGRRRKTHSRRR